MYYVEENDKIVLFDEDYQKLRNTLMFMPQYAQLPIKQTDRPIVDFEWADTQEYADKKAAERETAFKKDFFEIPGFGWFRKQPKGYSSAVESITCAFNMVGVLGGIPAGTLIFYTAPDFYDAEQCTEEWLVAHQIPGAAMDAQSFGQFYATFLQAWNTQEHLKEVEAGV